MRQFTILVFTLFTIGISAQQATFQKFYKTHKNQSEFSINLNASFAGAFLDGDDKDDLKKLIKKSSDFKLMVFSNEHKNVTKDFKKYLRRHKLKTMARVKSDNNRAAFYILEKNDRIKEIVLQAKSDEDQLVVFGLKTDLTKDELAEIISDSNIKISNNK